MDLGNNLDIHALWIGELLSPMELLTIKSFIYHGHKFNLWCYSAIKTDIPQECIIQDANEIIPASEIFTYKAGPRVGSVVGFSDLFRAKLLFQQGGWYIDMDVTCLKPFKIDEPYLFVSHPKQPTVQNIVKSPKEAEVMHEIYEELATRVDENNVKWNLPIEISARHIKEKGLLKYRNNSFSNDDIQHDIWQYYVGNKSFREDWYAFHWCNQWIKELNLGNNAIKWSTFHKLCLDFGIQAPTTSSVNTLYIKTLCFLCRYKIKIKNKLIKKRLN
jgi:hypothetical protein